MQNPIIRLLIIYINLFVCLGFYKSQNLYSKDYGNKKNPAIIFIHGGPSGNSTLFESTTAENLSKLGFYVIVYDRRGEGRSIDKFAKFTFKESNEDLLYILKKYKIKKANILAHSFGGIVATMFTNKYPDKVNSLILAGALINQQEIYNHILSEGKAFFSKNFSKLKQIEAIESLNKNSADYRKQCFELASEMNFFRMPKETQESILLRENYEKSDFFKNNIRNQEAPIQFYLNEPQNNIDIKPFLKKIKIRKIPIYGIYGNDDNIFPKRQLQDLTKIIGESNVKNVENCSHYLFVDQQSTFLNFIKSKINLARFLK